MTSRVLWEIDSETSGHTFERLCVDLLHRNGYPDIVPIEPQDGGRDAEDNPRTGRSGEGHPVFFQFSLEKDWKAKLRRDAKKLELRRSDFDTLVFVTSQTARGVDIDAIRKEFREQYGWNLQVYGREWLRFQLEEKHPDLALRHLGVQNTQHKTEMAALFGLDEAIDAQLRSAKKVIDAEDFDLGNAKLKRFLLDHPDSHQARQLLAWSYYRQDRFDEGLAEINRAQRLKNDAQSRSIKACILAEKGISEHDRSSLVTALDLMKAMLEDPRALSWELLYNLGNVLGALDRHEEAIHYYRGAVALDSKQPTLWKNLASALHDIGQHQQEMDCLDRALELNPQQPEALVSKAVSLLMDFGKADEAVALFQLAMRLSPDSISKWPHVLFWYALAEERLSHLREALALIDQSLEQQPGDRPSRNRKSILLGRLLLEDRSFEERAFSFWQSELALEPRNFEVRRNLVKMASKSDPEEAWKLVDAAFAVMDLQDVTTLKGFEHDPLTALDALEFLPQYRFLRIQQPLSTYWNSEDPLMSGHAYEENDEVAKRLFTYFGVAFGRAWRAFLEEPEAKSDWKKLATLFDSLRADVLKAVTEASRCLGTSIGALKADVNAVSSSFASAIMFFNTVALREFAFQRGSLMREFEVEASVKDSAMNDYDENQLNQDVLGTVITAINDGARLFPGDDERS